jgi:hypothetical protein
MQPDYDSYTAVTFLMVGLGVGALLAIVLAPRIRRRSQNLMSKDFDQVIY